MCNAALGENSKTSEHIFPDWLIKRYQLVNQRLILPNKTNIKYSSVKIPCCSTCNKEFLSRLEKKISHASARGYDYFKLLKRKTIAVWLIKIFYELLYMDTRLLNNRAELEGEKILDKEFIKMFNRYHLFLQSTRININFKNPKPWSILLVKTQKYYDNFKDFDYMDDIETQSVAIRLGDIGIIACLGDNSAQQKMFNNYFKKIKKINLHPIQFKELCAHVFYKSKLFNRTPKYLFLQRNNDPNKLDVISIWPQGLSSQPMFEAWNERDFAKILCVYCMVPFNKCYKNGKVWSILYNPDKTFKKLDINTCGF